MDSQPKETEVKLLFQEARTRLFHSPWTLVDNSEHWSDILPIPEQLNTVDEKELIASKIMGLVPTPRQEWQTLAEEWYASRKKTLAKASKRIRDTVTGALRNFQAEKHYPVTAAQTFVSFMGTTSHWTFYEITHQDNTLWNYKYHNKPDLLDVLGDFDDPANQPSLEVINSFIQQQYDQWLTLSNPTSVSIYQTTDPVPVASSVPGKKAGIRPFLELLADGYTKEDLDRLLVHLRMKTKDGKPIWPKRKKAALYGVVDALLKKNHLISYPQVETHLSLSAYLDLPLTRAKKGYSDVESQIKEKSISFLNQPVKLVK